MKQVIDRRLMRKKSATNRHRFIQRNKEYIKKKVAEAVNKRNITDIESGEKIKIPGKDLSEPFFHHGSGGKNHHVHPGNKEFVTGDRIKKNEEGGGKGSGSEASQDGEGQDDFIFHLSKEEFLDLFFEDLELPDLIKKDLTEVEEFTFKRSGYVSQGTHSNLSVIRSFREALGRRICMRKPIEKKIMLLEKKMEKSSEKEKIEIEKEISTLKRKKNRIPFLDPVDLRYHHKTKIPEPAVGAVMFCIMDVSGSMDEEKKEIAKRFFILLYLFLKKNYKKVDIVFIRHHTIAKEVDEQDFFYSRETGGTVVSSALELMSDIIEERYSSARWNIYGAQASDGDNWSADSPLCKKIIEERIMPHLQYYAYVEICARYHQSLWEVYSNVSEKFDYFSMRSINKISEIYPVFRELFKRSAA